MICRSLRNSLCLAAILSPGGSAFLLPSQKSSPIGSCSSTTTTALFDKKSSDRARMEREFEESMGDDWRVFRAKLVAQEQAESQKKANDWHHQHQKPTMSEEMEQQGHNTDVSFERKGQMFGSEISKILFHGKSPTSSQRTDYLYGGRKEKKVESITQHRARVMSQGGTSFGPADTSSALSPTSSETTKDNNSGSTSNCDDPFASPEELPCIKPQEVQAPTVTKHRWAHPISHIEEGAVMLASEKLGGVFHQTVLLVVDHHEKTGTCAVVINR